MTDVVERARAWAAEDPDEQTRAELLDLIGRADEPEARADLEDRFRTTLEFGTAGLRGALGAGPNRMYRVVVIRAAAGMRTHHSSRTARVSSGVVIGASHRLLISRCSEDQ